MIKRISILFLTILLALSVCSCGKTEKTTPDTVTQEETVPVAEEGATGIESQAALDLINNLPEYEFDEVIEEHYDENSKDYYINAKATKQQFDEYVELCEKAGYIHHVDDGSDSMFFNAYSDSGMEVSVSYSEKESTVFVLVYHKSF